MVKKADREAKELLNKGAWTAEEDHKLVDFVRIHGDHKNWRTLPAKAGLNRCGKSCRMRWMNYLRPGIRRGNISEDEEDLIIRLHNLLGNRWALIAGRLPGRTDNEIKNHWNTHLSKKSLTITDLNVKLNKKPESKSSGFSNTTAAPDDRSSGVSPVEPTNWDETSHTNDKLWTAEFDDRLFDFPSLPEDDLHSSGSEFIIKDYGFIGQGTCQRLHNTGGFQGFKQDNFENHMMHNQLDFDDLARIWWCSN